MIVATICVASKLLGGGVDQHQLLLQAILDIGSLWSFVVFPLMLSRVQGFGFWRTGAAYVLGLAFPMLIALVIRTFLFQPFNAPSWSMAPTLLMGDYFFVSKYAYGYTRYSIPFSPGWFSSRILASKPARGDVAVFRTKERVDYVKRVIGLPGDRIQMKLGLLYINDVPVTRERLSDFVDGDACGSDAAGVKRWRETLPNGVSYETLDCIDNGFYDNTNVYAVPAGHFFLVGDNRDNSTDSRVLSAIGYVPIEKIIGRVGIFYFSRSVAGVRADRIGQIVH
jgi:signal peptidase I